MADNDIFRKNVRKEFQSASRAVVRYGNVEQGVEAAVRVISADLLDWSPSTIGAARRIHSAALVPLHSNKERNSRIDQIHELEGSTQPEIVKDAAGIALQAVRRGEPVSSEFAGFLQLATVEFITRQLFPRRAISDAVTQYGRTHSAILADKARFERELANDPEFQRRVLELACCPIDAQSKKNHPPKASLELLLDTPLLEFAG